MSAALVGPRVCWPTQCQHCHSGCRLDQSQPEVYSPDEQHSVSLQLTCWSFFAGCVWWDRLNAYFFTVASWLEVCINTNYETMDMSFRTINSFGCFVITHETKIMLNIFCSRSIIINLALSLNTDTMHCTKGIF